MINYVSLIFLRLKDLDAFCADSAPLTNYHGRFRSSQAIGDRLRGVHPRVHSYPRSKDSRSCGERPGVRLALAGPADPA